MKCLLVVMISAVALNVAYGLSEGATNQETPFNCLGSESAKKPSKGREICREVRGRQIMEDSVFECTCALATHTYWYKRLATEGVRRLAATIDGAFNEFLDRDGKRERRAQPKEMLVVGPFDQVEFMKRLADFQRSSVRDDVYYRLAAAIHVESGPETTTRVEYATGEKTAKAICQELLADKKFNEFIMPTLNVIKATEHVGELGYRSLVISVPDLERIIAVANLCQGVLGVQAS